MSVAAIRTAIKTTLDTIEAFKNVHKYEPKDYKSLPAASIFFDGFEQADESMANNQMTYRFMVRVAVALNKNADEAQTELDTLIDTVVSTVARDRTLGNKAICYNAMVTTGDVLVVQNQQNAQLVGELLLTAEGLISRT